ncbi:XkdF-like putative serine protease domain-containing protein [Cryobacterium sp. GrIS_2_6]|uniref:XkdF-like putative serine protease domain-containing protein n=1 Tax=Cryobacterium sp. GrIS_2_6 TaxID=3162785 RepID=UPI002E059E77|nr:hypothetical protein [Cryobacterium psychrotolerans]MEC5149234.1 hypothetical protein [Cryobacterium psychrotolerans]MEC5149312.1 hypothetical protein [Cryobacterium psychrotolerans]
MAKELRIVLGVAYQAGPDPRIKKGADGSRDYFTADELEKAAATFLRDGGRQIGIEHMDGTIGHAEVCESYTWPSDDPFVIDGEVVASKGDWLIKALLDEVSWELVKSGKLTGFSPQGSATRKRRA